MWSSETQRLGKQKCTQLGYRLHLFADTLGAIGLFSLIILILIFIYQSLFSNSEYFQLWYFIIPFGLGIIGNILFSISWSLAYKKNFEYHYEKDEATWVEDGEVQVFKYVS